jgi:hypothetical protein
LIPFLTPKQPITTTNYTLPTETIEQHYNNITTTKQMMHSGDATKRKKKDRVSIQTPDDEDLEAGGGHAIGLGLGLGLASPIPNPTASYPTIHPSGHQHEEEDDDPRLLPSIPTPRRSSKHNSENENENIKKNGGPPNRQRGLPGYGHDGHGGFHGLNKSMAKLDLRHSMAAPSAAPVVPDYNDYLRAQRGLATKGRHSLLSTMASSEYSRDSVALLGNTRFTIAEGGIPEVSEREEEESERPPPTTTSRPAKKEESRTSNASSTTSNHHGRKRVSEVISLIGGRMPHMRESASWQTFLEHQYQHQHEPHDDDDPDQPDGYDLDEHGHDHNASIPLYCVPVQRQRWGDDQILPHINWGDLFFDLFYVAAAYNLGVLLISSMNADDWKRGLVYFIGIFGPLYNTWENDMNYSGRYTVVDHAHRIFEVIRYLLVGAAVLNVKTLTFMADSSSFETFSLMTSLFLESAMQLGFNLEVAYFADGDRTAIYRHTVLKIRNHVLPSVLVYGAAASIAGFLFFDASSTDRRSLALSSDGATIASMLGDGWRLSDAPYLLSLTGYVLQLFGTAIYKIRLSHTTEDIRDHFGE